MAFWLLPGQPYGKPCSSGVPFTTAQNTTVVSGHTLNKTVSVGYLGIPNVVRYDVAFNVSEAHQSATFEAVTGYMPPDFSVLLKYDPSRRLLSTSDGVGEKAIPVIVATKDGRHAMGVSSFNLPQATFPDVGYGAFRFPDTTKWNCVYREGYIAPGSTSSYTCLLAIGSVDEVISAQNALYASGGRPAPLFRFFNGKDHFVTASYNEGSNAGYVFEGTAFNVYASNVDGGMAPIHRCYSVATGDHFIARDSTCEGQQIEGVYGYISTYSRPGFMAVYRFYHTATGDHLTTTNYAEGINTGYSLEGVLGYAPAI